jgi:hypothetical protein
MKAPATLVLPPSRSVVKAPTQTFTNFETQTEARLLGNDDAKQLKLLGMQAKQMQQQTEIQTLRDKIAAIEQEVKDERRKRKWAEKTHGEMKCYRRRHVHSVQLQQEDAKIAKLARQATQRLKEKGLPDFLSNLTKVVAEDEDGDFLDSYTGEIAINIGTNAIRKGKSHHGNRYTTHFKKGNAFLAQRVTTSRAFKLMSNRKSGGFLSRKQTKRFDKKNHSGVDVGTAGVHTSSVQNYFSELAKSYGIKFGLGDFGNADRSDVEPLPVAPPHKVEKIKDALSKFREIKAQQAVEVEWAVEAEQATQLEWDVEAERAEWERAAEAEWAVEAEWAAAVAAMIMLE